MKANFYQMKGSSHFRVKIAYSVLLNKPIEMRNIRATDINPGLTDYEMSFLKLIEKITNGTQVKIFETGVGLRFTPGIITNNYGEEFDFTVDGGRGISYYLEGLVPIAMFGKESLQLNLYGSTNNEIDSSCDCFKNVTCPLLQKLVIGDTFSLNIKKRSISPDVTGNVKFKCPIVTFLNVFDWITEGKIKRIRGNAFTIGVSGSNSTRMIDATRGTFNNFLPDVWIAVDNYRPKGEVLKGYGMSIYGETTNGYFISHDGVYGGSMKETLPEEFGRKCSLSFLEEVFYSGAVDTNNQGLFLFLMALSTNNLVSKVKLGRISKNTASLLRLIRNLLGIKFKISKYEVDDYDNEEGEVLQDDDNESNLEENQAEDDQDDAKEEVSQGDTAHQETAMPDRLVFSCVGFGLKNAARIEF